MNYATICPMRILPAIIGVSLAFSIGRAFADPPRVEDVRTDELGGAWTISVTLRHPDTGWDHYADGWEVLAPDGTRLGFRELAHPHVNEQPFTRSLSGIAIPKGTPFVLVRAHCNVDGWNTDTFKVQLGN